MASTGSVSTGSMSKGSRQSKRPAPLRMVKEEVRQYRQPVIIHTYSPKIIHVDASEFLKTVQSLTGRGQKRKPVESPKARIEDEFSCASPSSSADSGFPGAGVGYNGLVSPRGPFPSYEHLYQQGCELSSAPLNSQEATDHATNMLTNAVIAAAAASAGPQYSPLFTNSYPSFPHLFSPLPSPNLSSPNFMADLPALSPSAYQAYDSFSTNAFVPSPGYGRFSNAGLLPSPGSIKDHIALMMSKD